MPAGNAPIRIAAIDDHPIIIEALSRVLTADNPQIVWLGSAPDSRGLTDLLDALVTPPNVVLVDLELGAGEDAFAVIAEVTRRGARALVFTSQLRPMPARRSVECGAMGVALKADPVEKLLDCIEQVARGEFVVSSDLALMLVTDRTVAAKLAPREVEVLRLLAQGVQRQQVGARMQPPAAYGTVVTYLGRIRAKYEAIGRDIGSSHEAVIAAIEDGYLDTPRRGELH